MVIEGIVTKGSQDGRKLGFPTANIELTNLLEIDYGVYASIVLIDKIKYQAITHFGPRLVFDELKPQFEVHIFNFEKDIYNQSIQVELLKFLRPTQKFDNIESMVEQIRKDIDEAKKYFESLD